MNDASMSSNYCKSLYENLTLFPNHLSYSKYERHSSLAQSSKHLPEEMSFKAPRSSMAPVMGFLLGLSSATAIGYSLLLKDYLNLSASLDTSLRDMSASIARVDAHNSRLLDNINTLAQNSCSRDDLTRLRTQLTMAIERIDENNLEIVNLNDKLSAISYDKSK